MLYGFHGYVDALCLMSVDVFTSTFSCAPALGGRSLNLNVLHLVFQFEVACSMPAGQRLLFQGLGNIVNPKAFLWPSRPLRSIPYLVPDPGHPQHRQDCGGAGYSRGWLSHSQEPFILQLKVALLLEADS